MPIVEPRDQADQAPKGMAAAGVEVMTMGLTRRQLLRLGLGAGAGIALPWSALVPPARARTGPWQPLVLAFYYPWYGGPAGWRHWRDCGHDPNRTTPGARYPGGLRRDIDAVDYPALGPYDSLDPLTLQRHCTQLTAAGVDALITSWWGPGTYEDTAVPLELEAAAANGLQVSAYFEIFQIFPGGDTGTVQDPNTYTRRPQEMAETVDRLVYLLRSYGSHPAWLRARRPRGGPPVPVVFVYQSTFFAPSEWTQILAEVRARAGDAFFTADTSGADLVSSAPFDGIHSYTLTHLTRDGALALAAGDPVQYLSKGSVNVNPTLADLPGEDVWNAAELGTDERALAAVARARGQHWAATVMPGFDDSSQRAACRPDSFYTARRGGDFYRQSWQLALATRPDWVLVTTFNEWHEGSEIEPSVQYGDSYLDMTRQLGGPFRGH